MLNKPNHKHFTEKQRSMKKALLLVFIVFTSVTGFTQDVHLSQFYMSPLTLNPALTGVFNGNYRITGNYRNQWASVISNPFETVAGAIELSGKSGSYNRIGGGLHVLSDKAGTSQLTTNIFSGSLSYNIALSRDQDYFVSTGLQVSYTQRSFNPASLTFGNQYQNSGFCPECGNGENLTSTHYSYVDAGAGILWYHINQRNKRSNQFLGASVFHVNRPNVAFLVADEDKLYTKFVGHAGLEIPVAPKMSLTPYLLGMMQGPSFETEVGTLVKFILEEKKTSTFGGTNFYIGPFYRIVGDQNTSISSDALIIATKLDWGGFTFGLSYDVNVSGLSPASSSRGGPELAVQYIGTFKNVSHKVFCPRF